MTHDRRYYGKYRGTVVNAADPERRARLQALVPDVLGSEATTWAMPAAPFTGLGAGFVVVPSAGSGVWIEFEQGDPDFPIWTGGWWGASNELPPLASSAPPDVGQVTIVTPGGQAVVISDLPGPTGGVSLRASTGARISVTNSGIVIDNGQGASIALTGNRIHVTGVMV